MGNSISKNRFMLQSEPGGPVLSRLATMACGAVFWLIMSPCLGYSQGGSDKILAKVGEEIITQADLEHVVRSIRVKGQFAQALKIHTEEGRKEILRKMIETLLLYQGASRDGFLEKDEVRRKLRWNSSQLVAEEYAKEKLFSRHPSREDMLQFYEGHKDLFKVPSEVEVRQIVVKELGQAETILKDVKGGASFEEMAREHNVDATKKQGGLIGWIRPGMMVEPFDTAAFSLGKGQTSEIVETRFGFHILKIEDRKEGSVKPFEQVNKDVVKAMREEQLEHFKAELSETYEVKTYE